MEQYQYKKHLRILSFKVLLLLRWLQILSNHYSLQSYTATQYLQSIKNASNNNGSSIKQNYISIDKGLKPLLLKKLASLPAKNASCNIDGCPIWWKSHFDLGTTLGMIGNVSRSTGILILQGENDTKTPVQQAFLLQQRLTDVKSFWPHVDYLSRAWSWFITCNRRLSWI